MGVAVQSHWFSVGPIVPWAESGVGAVATQANIEVAYGHRALALMRDGLDASAALARLVAADSLAETRQVAVIDAAGTVAAHTGDHCMPSAGHVTADGVSCQANIMATPHVWPAMLAAYEVAPGPLTCRLMAALHAAEAAGGDLRGRQSAAVLVVPASGEPWDTIVSLRVEDHSDPLAELERLLVLDEAYKLAGLGDELSAAGDFHQGAVLYQQAAALAPESDELRFWAGLGAVQRGDLDGGLALVRSAIAAHPGWYELLQRLTPDLSPVASTVLERLPAAATEANP